MLSSNGAYGDDDTLWLDSYLELLNAVLGSQEASLAAIAERCWQHVEKKATEETPGTAG